MIGCKLLYDVCEALQIAKENDKPFGGINIIFMGDFAQLPPVGQVRLYAHLNTRSTGQLHQMNMIGKVLWYSVDTVVQLHEVMWQAGSANEEFISLLALESVRPDWNTLDWNTAPVIVYENAIKDAVNEDSARSFSRHTG
ncbi:uncharacterized protein EV420DRAFT_1621676 [Desarmillaria tabescens]|uniref:ATP-dependent DNA helicase n=1 Tax=Armillaria tabescens TaxID=1929756 RepID=A0AA39MZV8_ARMTA|nr:uncharacterized protein EV420DRAFT_1621676 [Desarmillaria tabescens]KAK0452807.1 hypothetical protein EV420DRAFT_1621676 [Desarmillaria tabescens]